MKKWQAVVLFLAVLILLTVAPNLMIHPTDEMAVFVIVFVWPLVIGLGIGRALGVIWEDLK